MNLAVATTRQVGWRNVSVTRLGQLRCGVKLWTKLGRKMDGAPRQLRMYRCKRTRRASVSVGTRGESLPGGSGGRARVHERRSRCERGITEQVVREGPPDVTKTWYVLSQCHVTLGNEPEVTSACRAWLGEQTESRNTSIADNTAKNTATRDFR